MKYNNNHDQKKGNGGQKNNGLQMNDFIKLQQEDQHIQQLERDQNRQILLKRKINNEKEINENYLNSTKKEFDQLKSLLSKVQTHSIRQLAQNDDIQQFIKEMYFEQLSKLVFFGQMGKKEKKQKFWEIIQEISQTQEKTLYSKVLRHLKQKRKWFINLIEQNQSKIKYLKQEQQQIQKLKIHYFTSEAVNFLEKFQKLQKLLALKKDQLRKWSLSHKKDYLKCFINDSQAHEDASQGKEIGELRLIQDEPKLRREIIEESKEQKIPDFIHILDKLLFIGKSNQEEIQQNFATATYLVSKNEQNEYRMIDDDDASIKYRMIDDTSLIKQYFQKFTKRIHQQWKQFKTEFIPLVNQVQVNQKKCSNFEKNYQLTNYLKGHFNSMHMYYKAEYLHKLALQQSENRANQLSQLQKQILSENNMTLQDEDQKKQNSQKVVEFSEQTLQKLKTFQNEVLDKSVKLVQSVKPTNKNVKMQLRTIEQKLNETLQDKDQINNQSINNVSYKIQGSLEIENSQSQGFPIDKSNAQSYVQNDFAGNNSTQSSSTCQKTDIEKIEESQIQIKKAMESLKQGKDQLSKFLSSVQSLKEQDKSKQQDLQQSYTSISNQLTQELTNFTKVNEEISTKKSFLTQMNIQQRIQAEYQSQRESQLGYTKQIQFGLKPYLVPREVRCNLDPREIRKYGQEQKYKKMKDINYFKVQNNSNIDREYLKSIDQFQKNYQVEYEKQEKVRFIFQFLKILESQLKCYDLQYQAFLLFIKNLEYIQRQFFLDIIAKKISYTVFNLMILIYIERFSQLFTNEIMLYNIQLCSINFHDKSDKNFRSMYNEYRHYKNNESNNQDVRKLYGFGKLRYSLNLQQTVNMIKQLGSEIEPNHVVIDQQLSFKGQANDEGQLGPHQQFDGYISKNAPECIFQFESTSLYFRLAQHSLKIQDKDMPQLSQHIKVREVLQKNSTSSPKINKDRIDQCYSNSTNTYTGLSLDSSYSMYLGDIDLVTEVKKEEKTYYLIKAQANQ